MATAPDERFFVTYARGKIRDDVILASFRQALRDQPNPETGEAFTEDEVRLATSEGTPTWARADAIDLFGQSSQARALFLATQLDPRLANTNWLRNFHAPLWLPDGPLPATGGSGPASAGAVVGTIFVGSTTVGDPAAHTARDPAGNLYQVLTTTVTGGSGVASLTLVGVSTGSGTNPESGTTLTWVSPPTGADSTCSTTSGFEGGFDDESDADLAARVVARMQNRPASGNNAQVEAWARAASNAVEAAFVYACALHAGTLVGCVTQKRGTAVGPTARVPSTETLLAVRAYMTPPGSPVVPQRWHSLWLPPQSDPTNLGLTLTMRRGSSGGWEDLAPWPYSSGSWPAPRINSVSSQTDFSIATDSGSLPSGMTVPSLMVWHPATSEFEELDVLLVTDLGGDVFRVQLNSPPSFTVAPGDRVCPHTARKSLIAQAVSAYFDSLGPGELLDLATDLRGDRAWRYPPPEQEYPQEAGQLVVTYLQDALGAALTSADVAELTVPAPVPPAAPTDGPLMLTLNQLGVYPVAP